MKAITTTLLFCATLVSLAFAQAVEKQGALETGPMAKRPDYNNAVRTGAGDSVSAWLNYFNTIGSRGGLPSSYFRNYLYPDSTVKTNFTTSVGHVWKHSFGEVLHPNLKIWGDYNGPEIGTWSPYRLDSITIYYRYFRFDDVDDKLVVQYYDDSKIQTNLDPGWNSGASYANVGYDYTARKGADPTKEIVVNLTQDDTVGVSRQGKIVLPLMTPLTTGLSAVTVTFFPGKEAALGDTIDVYTFPDVKNKVNAFIAYDRRDELPYVAPGNYNNGLMVTQSVRYNESTNGWNGRYQPGTSWASASGIYHFDMDFKIVYDPENNSVGDFSDKLALYPNPANNHINLQVEDLTGYQCTVYDLQGKSVLQVGELMSGSIDIAELPKGMYQLELAKEDEIIRESFVKL